MAKPEVQAKINDTLYNTKAKRELFIEALRKDGVIKYACEAAGIARKTAYRWRKKWSTFAAEWDLALEDAVDELEKTAIERAKDKSDALLIFLLRVHRYDKQKKDAMLTVEHDEEGRARITVSRVAPGLLDNLLEGSPVLDNSGDSDA